MSRIEMNELDDLSQPLLHSDGTNEEAVERTTTTSAASNHRSVHMNTTKWTRLRNAFEDEDQASDHRTSSSRDRRKVSAMQRLYRACTSRTIKRATLLLPIAILSALGFIHALEAVVGRSHIFWNPYEYDPAMTDWSKPGFRASNLSTYSTRAVLAIPCHSHNDYQRHVPLYEAISWGCASVEADVWMLNGEVLVGHEHSALDPNRTLQNMYIDPLVQLLDRQNNHLVDTDAIPSGIFETDPQQSLVLLIDFKQSVEELFNQVRRRLQPLRNKNYLSHWDGHRFVSRPITVVLSGSVPFEKVTEISGPRDVFYDAPLHQLPDISQPSFDTQYTQDAFNISNSYYASTSFKQTVGQVWHGHLSPRQMSLIRNQIQAAKMLGLKSRYWSTPSWPISLRNHVWHVLMKEGSDILNVDDLKAATAMSWEWAPHGWWS